MSSKKFPRNPWAIAAHHRNSAGPIPSDKKEESRKACKREYWIEEVEPEDFIQLSEAEIRARDDEITPAEFADMERWKIQDWLAGIDDPEKEPDDK
jgi:hypothetical protein